VWLVRVQSVHSIDRTEFDSFMAPSPGSEVEVLASVALLALANRTFPAFEAELRERYRAAVLPFAASEARHIGTWPVEPWELDGLAADVSVFFFADAWVAVHQQLLLIVLGDAMEPRNIRLTRLHGLASTPGAQAGFGVPRQVSVDHTRVLELHGN
jgi:hypothetical protein